jgi:hypothetical protein
MATEIWTYQDRSLTELDLTGFDVETRDGVVGRVDRATREVGRSYVVIDPGAAMPLGRRLLVPAGVVDTVDLDARRLFVDASRSELLSSPEFSAERALDATLRDRVAKHYSRGRAGSSREAAGTQRRRRASPQRPRKRQQTRGRSTSTRPRSRSRSSDEPTKAELYQQAKRLGIEGRSKMNKTQLKRAVSRRK